VKIHLNGLYDILGSAEARGQFEDSIIQRLREKLGWLKKRVNLHKKLEGLLENTSSHDRFGCVLFSEYNKVEWTAIVGILQTLTGEVPGDNEPFDTESITEVLIEYRRWVNLAEPGSVPSDGKSQNPSMSAASELNEAIERAISEIGHPAREVPLKTFCAKVWELCGVEPEAKRYSSRTIRRLVANRRN
jgi:hypothetical protein